MNFFKDIQAIDFFTLCYEKMKNFLSLETMKLLYYSFFHSHLEFSSTFLMLTSNKYIDKIIANESYSTVDGVT